MQRRKYVVHPVLAFSLGFVLVAAGCSGISVNSIHDPQYGFSGDSYVWAEQEVIQSAELPYDLIDRVVKEVFDDQMSSQGFSKATSGRPDYVLLYYVGQEQITRVRTTSYPGYYGGYGRWGRRGWGGVGVGGTSVNVSQYDEGSLTLDILDGQSEELIWRGTAKGTVHSGDEPAKRRQKIAEVAMKLLEGFPPARQ